MTTDDELRDLLLAVEVPPTTADVGLAIATGRRQAARRGAILAGAAAALVVAGGTAYALGAAAPDEHRGAPAAHGPQDPPFAACAVDTIQVPGAPGIPVVDPSGRYVVGSVGGIASRITDGQAVAYPGATGEVVAVNVDGVIAGYDDVVSSSQQLAWTYRDGAKTMLPKLAGYPYTTPTALNARGDVVGYASGEAGDDNVPVLWPADRPGTVVALPVPPGFGTPGTGGSHASGVSDDGVVVGVVRGAAVRWVHEGSPALLPLPAGYEGAEAVTVRGTFAYGWAAVTGGNRVVPVRWFLSSAAGDSAFVMEGAPSDIADGTPNGWSITIGGDLREPVRLSPGGIVQRLPLPPGVRPLPAGSGAGARSISDDGRTVTGATGDRRLLIWHCDPPS
ncbi:hypothetical protein GCM10009827_006450 [Dactylosporangium maewongense]|uniref:Uncharacterized protein n=1 Tax=Dactylosporangium maewongense TaxID=634393 RepID=A0ABN1ZL01_9ACTN